MDYTTQPVYEEPQPVSSSSSDEAPGPEPTQPVVEPVSAPAVETAACPSSPFAEPTECKPAFDVIPEPELGLKTTTCVSSPFAEPDEPKPDVQPEPEKPAPVVEQTPALTYAAPVVAQLVEPVLEPLVVEKPKEAVPSESFQPLVDLIMWEKPVKSGIVFGCIVALYWALGWSGYSLLTLFSRINLLLLLVYCVHIYGAKFAANYLGIESARQAELEVIKVDPKTVEDLVKNLCGLLGPVVQCAANIFYFTHPMQSFKIFLCLILMAIVGKLMSGITLLFSAAVIAFSIPKLYKSHKQFVDLKCEEAKNFIEPRVQQLLSKLPPKVLELLHKHHHTE